MIKYNLSGGEYTPFQPLVLTAQSPRLKDFSILGHTCTSLGCQLKILHEQDVLEKYDYNPIITGGKDFHPLMAQQVGQDINLALELQGKKKINPDDLIPIMEEISNHFFNLEGKHNNNSSYDAKVMFT